MNNWLIGAVSAAALMLPHAASAQDDTIKIGVLAALDGVFAAGAKDGVQNVELAIAENDGMAGGKKIEIVVAPTDTTGPSTPPRASHSSPST